MIVGRLGAGPVGVVLKGIVLEFYSHGQFCAKLNFFLW